MAEDFEYDDDLDSGIAEATKDNVKEPEMYKVVLLNDHFTSMDFVVQVISIVFHKSVIEANKIMMDVHKKGKGIVGVYTYDIAATKIMQVNHMAREKQFPLKCVMEEA